MIVDVNSVTMTGLVRTRNQDSIFCAFSQNTGVFVVADGMGGHYQGEIASGMATAELSKWWGENQSQIDVLPFGRVVDLLEKQIRDINRLITEHYQMLRQTGGTTFCALLIHQNAYAVFNIGDSRLYLCTKRRVRQLTTDDVWENQPQIRHLKDSPVFITDPRKGKLVRAMGIARETGVSISTNAMEKKMVFFLCSDGVYKYLPEKQLKELLKGVRKKGDAASANEKIRGKVYENGAADNVSMVTVLVRK